MAVTNDGPPSSAHRPIAPPGVNMVKVYNDNGVAEAFTSALRVRSRTAINSHHQRLASAHFCAAATVMGSTDLRRRLDRTGVRASRR
jgi:hypothetical protein